METKFITDKDKAEYSHFGQHHFDKLVANKLVDRKWEPRELVPLYHYTTGENLIKIIRSGELWTTQIGCLNDSKELLHAIEIFRKSIEERLSKNLSVEFEALLLKMIEILDGANSDATGVFVACFSEEHDDLSQWRAYGGVSGGYSLKFDTKLLLQQLANQNAYLAPVTYDSDTKKYLMASILEWSENYLMHGIQNKRAPTTEEWIDEFANYWLLQLSHLAPLLKHQAFEKEAEWRLIYYLKDEDFKRLQFVEKTSMMRRHLPIQPGNADPNGYTPLPISGITVGPKSHQRLTRLAVGDLLHATGYSSEQVPVELSDIPYRTMN
ncbi:MAG: DUF2971 domain-containing protein [Rhodospirillales bacterium]